MLKGNKLHFSQKKASPKFRKIQENNLSVLKQFKKEGK